MKKIVAIFGAIVLSINFWAQTGEKNFIDQPYIEVNGKAEMEIVPDEIYLNIVLSEKDNKYKLSIAELDKKLLTSLKELGIDVAKELSLKDLSSNFKNQLILKDDIILTKEYELLVHDAKMVGKVARELEKVGISNISILKTDHSKMEDFRREVKVNAIKAARVNADVLTTAIGQTIGKALYIQELYMNVMHANMYMQKREMLSMDMAANEPEEMQGEFEKIKLEFTVLVRFELK